ncbi:hypothetical protein GJQ54_12505 [Oceanospirillaceae bacterium ASx5O]|nr:hypothetical protein GJQ54_12505 [Oceanospirillaceae bacterium ASx5O]
MIRRPAVFFWLSLQLAITAAGVLGTMLSPALGVLAGLIFLPANFMVLRKAWLAREQIERNKPLADAIAVAGLALFLVLLLSASLMPALVALLLLATLAMNAQLNRWRKFYVAQLISFVLLLAGAADATSGHYLWVMALYCLAAAFSLSEAWLDRGDIRVGDESGDRGESRAARQGPGAGARAVAGLLTMLVAFMIYVLMPRPDALNWGGQESSAGDFYHNEQWQQQGRDRHDNLQQKPQQETDFNPQRAQQKFQELSNLNSSGDGAYRYDGFGDQFDIRSSDRTGGVDLNAIVARLQAEQGAYLKIRTFDTFDGVSWSVSNADIARKLTTDRRGHASLNSSREGAFQQVITIEQPMPAWLPAAADPVALWVPASAIALDMFAQPLLPGPLLPGTRYTVQSARELQDNRPLSRAPAADAADLQIPDDQDPRIKKLAMQVTQNGQNSYQKAQLLEQHLRTQYAYSFASITESQGQTPLTKFLFEDKQGHCEYFASAMTIMLRTLDIPARLVTGFSATTRNPLTGYFDIRAIDGHAWTEAWIDGRWVTFEPTAYYDLPPPDQGRFTAEQLSRYAQDFIKRNQQGNADGEWTLTGLISALWLQIYTAVVLVLAGIQWLIITLLPLWVTALVLVAIAWLTRPYWQVHVRAWLSNRRIQRYQPLHSRLALDFYLHHLQRMAERQLPPRQPDELIEHWTVALQQQYGDHAEFQQLAAAVNRLVYQNDEVDVRELQQLALQVSALLRS